MEQALSASGHDEISSLQHYTRAKQEVAAQVRAVKHLAQAHDAQEAVERCQELVVQLAEDRFNLAVVGQFKRGKSTLMNAILGRDLLPTGLLPLTSAITTLCYGSTERVLLRRRGWTIEQEVPLTQLSDFITERGNPGNEKGLVEARVELPLPFLRRGLHFIDTPGIGSARQENTATTYAFLPQMNAVIFVTSVDAPLSKAEECFLLDIRGQVRQLFVVVNKMDMLSIPERQEVFDYIQTQVEHLLGSGKLHISPLSARDGLAAKLNHDEAGLHRSGLALFEQILATFLAEEQGRAFLVSLLDRTLHLLAEANVTLAPTPADDEAKSQESAVELRQAMESLHARLLTGIPLSGVRSRAEPITIDSHIIDQTIAVSQQEERQVGGGQTTVRTRSCPICIRLGQTLFAFFAQWQYTLASDATAQRAFAAQHGLCQVHTWQFQEMASPLGISEGYTPLIEAVIVELSRLIERPDEHAANALAALLSSMATCAACRLVRETETREAARLLAHLVTAEGRADYTSSAGLCLPHLQVTLARLEQSFDEATERGTIAEFLLLEQKRRLENLADDLHSYTLKRDAFRRGLLHREEAGAWWRALVQLVGERAARGGAMMADQGTV